MKIFTILTTLVLTSSQLFATSGSLESPWVEINVDHRQSEQDYRSGYGQKLKGKYVGKKFFHNYQKRKNAQIRALEDRVERLERAVVQLQYKMSQDSQKNKPLTYLTSYVCMLQDSFGESFLGKATTKVEAKSIALKSCENSRNLCGSMKMTCESTKVAN